MSNNEKKRLSITIPADLSKMVDEAKQKLGMLSTPEFCRVALKEKAEKVLEVHG
ncbi:MAG: ribbon-helix-helix domain-containing protein [Candidatus Bathyarchaeota archaeon]|nr:ribbon-helix-helix domain-containing protein [Candidatus Bathyarchaeota archaeon]